MKKLFPILLVVVTLFFFKQFLLSGQLPIPSDTIIGLYNPFRDLYAKDFPRGVPFKNSLITDPVRQQYPWRYLAVTLEKRFQLPLWNPYSMAGYPLLGNDQSAPLYPLNILFFFLPFQYAWSILIMLQPILAGVFLYCYLDNLRLHRLASLLGGLTFAFCGFSVAWLEWNTVVQTILWLPLILLSIDKVLLQKNKKIWFPLFVFSVVCAFTAGHLQTFFYVVIATLFYTIGKIYLTKNLRSLLFIIFGLLLAVVITSIQWIPTMQLIFQSARNIDLDWHKAGWFIPWQHLVQFISPDFFGNPATLNYWGEWNYGEFVGYVGIAPFVFALLALTNRRDKKTLFFGILGLAGLLFATQNPISEIPFRLNIPFLSTAQPTRLMGVIDFALSILAAFGLDHFIKNPKKIVNSLVLVGGLFVLLWVYVLYGNSAWHLVSIENLIVAKRNLVFPTVIFAISAGLGYAGLWLRKEKRLLILISLFILLTAIDLFRFADKFTPFTYQTYLFPSTKTIDFLRKNIGNYRFMTTDSRILPPNFSLMYGLQSVDGYDPLYLKQYGELIAASERGKPDITPPFGFNRIITPHNYDSKIMDLLGVKYILSLSDINSPHVKKVFQEGEARVYENKNVLPRAFFAAQTTEVNDNQTAINTFFDSDFNALQKATVENETSGRWSVGEIINIVFEPNIVIIRTTNSKEGFLVLTDSFYPTWHVKIDGVEEKITKTDYNFRGVVVPGGNHTVTFYDSL